MTKNIGLLKTATTTETATTDTTWDIKELFSTFALDRT